MCKPASFVLTKEKVYWSKNSDSHEDIIREFNLVEMAKKSEVGFVRVEIFPDNEKYELPLKKWKYQVDQDIFPSWYVAEYDEKRTRQELIKWKKEKIKIRVEYGNMNTGNRNTGDMNTGNRNTGNRNTGNMNTGDWNTGNMNTGNRNTGDMNTGDMNTGDMNTGDWNTGNMNTGDWNSTNYSSGIFCTQERNIIIFDADTTLSMTDWINSKWNRLLSSLVLTVWISKDNMTQEEIDQHPESQYISGYLKKFEFKEACNTMWNKFTQEEKKYIQTIPNFDPAKFEHITGIKV
jgi:hypothetical protein